MLELGTEDDVALTVLEPDAVVALEEVVLTETVVGLDSVAEAELVEAGETSVKVVEKADDTEVDDVALLVLDDEVETEAISDNDGGDEEEELVPDKVKVLAVTVLEPGWLDELEGDAVGVLDVDPTEADEAVEPTEEDVDDSPVLVLPAPSRLLYGDDDCVSLLEEEMLLGVDLVVGGIIMVELLLTDPLVREEVVGEVLDTDSLEELELPLLYDKEDCVLLGVGLFAVVLLNVELVAREVLVAETLSPKLLLRELLRVDVAVIELLNEAVLVVSTIELLLMIDEALATELLAPLDVELGAREMLVELLSTKPLL
ncbi:hypothetical protein PG996_009372 [Apiospora saccharicola]|uniref:Uncharacterized protein n=1 Tax=Apiospora saccharicola TaxID=335842 RepID=A0ABR1UKK8_9PEZI